MRKKLFGNSIKPNCSLCNHASNIKSGYICSEKRQIKNGKCWKFSYNPTLRIPEASAQLQQFKPEDFQI